MKNYSNGLTTKEKIIAVSKDLFYEKGYKNTTFAEICEVSQVNPGSIAYHFGTKRNIGMEIYKESLNSMVSQCEALFPEEDEIQQQMLSYLVYLKLVFIDAAYRVFLSELLSEAEYDDFNEDFLNMVPKAYKMTSDRIDPRKANFLFAIFMGMDYHIVTYIDRHIEALKFIEIAQYSLELYYMFIEPGELKERFKRNSILINKIKITNDGFNIKIEL